MLRNLLFQTQEAALHEDRRLWGLGVTPRGVPAELHAGKLGTMELIAGSTEGVLPTRCTTD